MPSNAELTELEQGIINYVTAYAPGLNEIVAAYTWDTPWSSEEVRQTIANLIAKSYIIGSHDTPIRYTAVGRGEL